MGKPYGIVCAKLTNLTRLPGFLLALVATMKRSD